MKTKSFKKSLIALILLTSFFNLTATAAIPLSDQQLGNLYGGGDALYTDYYCTSGGQNCPTSVGCDGYSIKRCSFCVPHSGTICASRLSGKEDLTCENTQVPCSTGTKGWCGTGDCLPETNPSGEYPSCSSAAYSKCID